MNKYLSAAVILTFTVTAVPAVPVYLAGRAEVPPQSVSAVIPTGELPEAAAPEVPAASEKSPAPLTDSAESYRVLDITTGLVEEVPLRDYIIGAVAAEMPATFETEALKAQAVAAHTYAERQRLREQESPTPELCGADFSNDTSKYQGWFTDSQIHRYYGDNYDLYYSKVAAAADEVLPYIVTYLDEPIIAAFHSMSSGRTESAENAWGTPVAYLTPADSSFDTEAPRYQEETRYVRPLLEKRLISAFEGITLGEDMSTWVTVGTVSDSGTVLTASAGDLTVTGNDIRSALGLRSACFEVTYDGDEAVFTTRGFGHGVGMSQYGANSMAQQGSSWREILDHYYPGCDIAVISG